MSDVQANHIVALSAAARIAARVLPVVQRFPVRQTEPLRAGLADLLGAAQAGELDPDEASRLVLHWSQAAEDMVTAPHLLAVFAPQLVARAEHAAHVRRLHGAASAPAEVAAPLTQARQGWVSEHADLSRDGLLPAILTDLATTDPASEAPHAVLSRWLLFNDLLYGHLLERGWRPLHDRIFRLLHQRRQATRALSLGGALEQGGALLGLGGVRPTGERLDALELDRWVRPGARALDARAANGVVALELARRGVRVDAMDPDPFLVAIAAESARFLGLSGARVVADDLQGWAAEPGYDLAVSLGAHAHPATRGAPPFEEHVARLFHALRPGGTLLFESHDLDTEDLAPAMDVAERYFEVICHRVMPPVAPSGDVERLVAVMRRRVAYDASARRDFSFAAARTGTVMEAPWQAADRWIASPPAPEQEPAAPPVEILERACFVIHVPDQVNYFREVWRAMDPERFDIVLVGDPRHREGTREAVELAGFPWLDVEPLIAARQVYAVAVANHKQTDLPQGNVVAVLGVIRARFFYALGKSGWNFAPWNALFDMHLVHGPRQAERLAAAGAQHVVQMGYPRYDALYRKEIDPAAIRQALGCRPGVPLVVWMPTWEAGCSVHQWTDAVSALQGDFEVFVKPHPQSWRCEPTVIETIDAAHFAGVVQENIDSVDLLAAADFVLADYGGIPFGALIADRKVVLLDAQTPDHFKRFGEASFDVELREHLIHLDPAHPERLREVLEDREMWAAQAPVRRRLRDHFVAPNYGFAARVAAASLEAAATTPIVLDWADPKAVSRRRMQDYRDGWMSWMGTDYFTWARALAAGRRVIGWGTVGVSRTTRRSLGVALDYLVDGEKEAWGTTIDGLRIHSPEQLLREDKGQVLVVVFSSYRPEIFEWLEKVGYVWLESYC